jgi:hypothetical protein
MNDCTGITDGITGSDDQRAYRLAHALPGLLSFVR